MAVKWTPLFVVCVAAVVDEVAAASSASPMQEASGYPSESWTEQAVTKFSQEKMGMDANSAKNAAHDFMENCKDAASKSTDSLNSAATGAARYASEKASGTYNNLNDAYSSAKDSMSEKARQTYETAKEKASKATGNVGAQMRGAPSRDL